MYAYVHCDHSHFCPIHLNSCLWHCSAVSHGCPNATRRVIIRGNVWRSWGGCEDNLWSKLWSQSQQAQIIQKEVQEAPGPISGIHEVGASLERQMLRHKRKAISKWRRSQTSKGRASGIANWAWQTWQVAQPKHRSIPEARRFEDFKVEEPKFEEPRKWILEEPKLQEAKWIVWWATIQEVKGWCYIQCPPTATKGCPTSTFVCNWCYIAKDNQSEDPKCFTNHGMRASSDVPITCNVCMYC